MIFRYQEETKQHIVIKRMEAFQLISRWLYLLQDRPGIFSTGTILPTRENS